MAAPATAQRAPQAQPSMGGSLRDSDPPLREMVFHETPQIQREVTTRQRPLPAVPTDASVQPVDEEEADSSTRQDQIDQLIEIIEQRVVAQIERRGSRFREVL